jgi:hypothetical protein
VNCACVGEIITIINENARNITHKKTGVLISTAAGVSEKANQGEESFKNKKFSLIWQVISYQFRSFQQNQDNKRQLYRSGL